nr:Crp/Fnr family transcriptional regulator [Aneurinibacillus terranovensis]
MEHLHKFEILNRLPDKLLHEVRDYLFFRKYRKGQCLFMEGDPRDRIYFSLNGYIKLTNTNTEGIPTLYIFVKPYSMFPYVGLFEDSHYKFSAEAVTDVEILYMTTEPLERILQRSNAALTHLVRIISQRLFDHEYRLQILTHTHAPQRVHQLLSFLMYDLGEKTAENTITIPCPLTTQELADMAGTSRETVSHLLQDYRNQGKLEFLSKIITIHDPDFFKM